MQADISEDIAAPLYGPVKKVSQFDADFKEGLNQLGVITTSLTAYTNGI